MTPSSIQQEYAVGVMLIDVEGKNSDRFHRLLEQAVQAFATPLRAHSDCTSS